VWQKENFCTEYTLLGVEDGGYHGITQEKTFAFPNQKEKITRFSGQAERWPLP